MATKKKKDEQKYAFQVSKVLRWQVMITRFHLVRHTEKSVTVLTSLNTEKRYARVSDSDEWFLDFESAQKRALEIVKQHRKELTFYLKKLKETAAEIRGRRIRETKPMNIKSGKFEL